MLLGIAFRTSKEGVGDLGFKQNDRKRSIGEERQVVRTEWQSKRLCAAASLVLHFLNRKDGLLQYCYSRMSDISLSVEIF